MQNTFDKWLLISQHHFLDLANYRWILYLGRVSIVSNLCRAKQAENRRSDRPLYQRGASQTVAGGSRPEFHHNRAILQKG
jgi:hypothetical protein